MSELQRNPLFRYLSMILMASIIVLFFLYARPVYIWFYYKLLHLYQWGPTASLISILDRVLPFDLSRPLLFVKLVTSTIHLLCMVGLAHLWFLDQRITRMAVLIIIGWFGAGILLNFAGRLTHNVSILEDARTFIDYLLQPLGIVFVIPVLILYRRQLPAKSLIVKAHRPPKALSEDEVIVTD